MPEVLLFLRIPSIWCLGTFIFLPPPDRRTQIQGPGSPSRLFPPLHPIYGTCLHFFREETFLHFLPSSTINTRIELMMHHNTELLRYIIRPCIYLSGGGGRVSYTTAATTNSRKQQKEEETPKTSTTLKITTTTTTALLPQQAYTRQIICESIANAQ